MNANGSHLARVVPLLLLLTGCGTEGTAESPNSGDAPAPAITDVEADTGPTLQRLVLAPRSSSGTPTPPVAVELSYEGRFGFELTSDEPLVAEVTPDGEAALRFGYGISQLPRRRGRPQSMTRPVVLVVTLHGDEGPLVEEKMEFPTGGLRQARWLDGTISLKDLPSEPLQVEFSLEVGRYEGVVAAIASPRVERPMESPPTALLFTSDTHRADQLGALGEEGTGVLTPNIDRLAERGVLFENCYAPINYTVASHASMLTGQHPRDTGILDNETGLIDEAMTLAEVYSEAGYATMAVASASILKHQNSGLGQGFDRLVAPGSGEVIARESVDRMLELLDAEPGVPVFAWLHLYDAHAPYDAPEGEGHSYYPEDRDPGIPSPDQPSGFNGVGWDPGKKDFDYFVAEYMSEITYLDATVASLLSRPRVENGIVAFTSDHGETMSGHGIFFNHLTIYPDTLAVPMILSWPGAPAGKRVEAPVTQEGLARALLELSGVEAEFPGTSLLRWLDEDPPAPEPRFGLAHGARVATIEHGGWLLRLNLRDTQIPPREKHQVELFDLSTDPDCLDDLVRRDLDRARGLRTRLIEWLTDSGQGLARPTQSEGIQEDLAALGYASEDEAEESEVRTWYESDPASAWCSMFDE